MAGSGTVFGSSGEVRALGSLARQCVSVIDENNQRAKSLLAQLSSSTKDAAYTEAQEVVSEVEKIVNACEEPLEQVCSALNAYADFLASMGKK